MLCRSLVPRELPRECRPCPEDALAQCRWAVQRSRQAGIAGRARTKLGFNEALVHHPTERHVDAATFEPAARGGDELQPVEVSVLDQQLQDQTFLLRQAG